MFSSSFNLWSFLLSFLNNLNIIMQNRTKGSDIMQDKNKSCDSKSDKAKKTAGDNQWSSKALKPSSPERRDGPGGENK